MIKKIGFNFIIISILIALIYSKYIEIIEIKNVLPDIFLILIVFNGIFNGSMFAMIFGFASGLALDISSYPLIGFYALIYTIIGYSTSVTKLFYINNYFLSSVFIFIYILLKSLIFLIIGLIFFNSEEVLHFFKNRFLIETIYTILVSIPFFLIYNRFYSEKRKYRKNV